MSVKAENLDKNMVKLTIEVSEEEFDKAIQNAYNKQKSQISIPGFRKGKVPRQMIEKMYGPQVFYEDAANEVMEAEYPKAVEESGLQIISRPNIDIVQVEKGKPFIFTAEVAVFPEVTLGEYKGIEVPINEIKVTDEEVEAELKREQEKNSRTITVDRPAENGDTVVLDYVGTIDGNAFDGGSAEDYSLKLGSNSFIPGFEDQLVGTKAEEEKDVTVTFPEDYHAEDLKGKEAVFHCTIHRVETVELPELDDEFAQDVSEFDTFAEYKDSIVKKLTEKKENTAKDMKRQAAVDKAVANATIEISDYTIRDHAQTISENFMHRLQQQGIAPEQYFKIMGMTPQQLVEQNIAQAETELKNTFFLTEVAKVENLEATDERVEQELEDMAKAYGIEVEKYKSFLPENYAEEMKEELKLQMAAELIGEAAVETEAATEAAKAAEEAAASAAKADAEEKADAE